MYTETGAGGPAFPGEGLRDPKSRAGEFTQPNQGMTLRDYFAAKAMNGLLADHVARIEGLNLTPVGLIASYSYSIADAMLAARGESK